MTRTASAKARSRARQEAKAAGKPRPKCPHPEKRAYPEGYAYQSALRSSKRIGRPIRIYKCPCGAHHLTQRVQPIRSES